jgi:steroid delta-isomerase-like uncharacterized protein
MPASNLTTSVSRRAALAGLGASGLGLVLASTIPPAAAQEATPGTLPAPIEAWLNVWTVDPARADTLYTADVILDDVAAGAVFNGLAQVKAHIEEEFTGFPGHTFEVKSAFVAGDRAVAEIVFSGVYTGTFAGLPPGSGQAVSLRVAAIFELAGNQIRREVHYYDTYSFLVQLGLLPAPGGEATPAT